MKLISSNHIILRTVSTEVKSNELDEIRGYYLPMVKLMRNLGGCGLAANQIGIPKRFFVWGYGMVINPVITSHSDETEEGLEGCLSFPGKTANKARYRWIEVNYIDERGVLMEKRLPAYPARVFQHETDHLEGICIV